MPDHEHPLRDRLLVTTKSDVDISFDPAKDEADIRKHGLSLATFIGFDDRPVTVIDDRFDYGEIRFRAFGRIGGVGHQLVYVEAGEGIRLISFRRAHEKEMRRHEQGTTTG